MNCLSDIGNNDIHVSDTILRDWFEPTPQQVPAFWCYANEPLKRPRVHVSHDRDVMCRQFTAVNLVKVIVLACELFHAIKLCEFASSKSLLLAVELGPGEKRLISLYRMTMPETLDSMQAIAINVLSDLQMVCLWRRFFGHSFVPCRRFARLYRLHSLQAILDSRVSTLSEILGSLFLATAKNVSPLPGFICPPIKRRENDYGT